MFAKLDVENVLICEDSIDVKETFLAEYNDHIVRGEEFTIANEEEYRNNKFSTLNKYKFNKTKTFECMNSRLAKYDQRINVNIIYINL